MEEKLGLLFDCLTRKSDDPGLEDLNFDPVYHDEAKSATYDELVMLLSTVLMGMSKIARLDDDEELGMDAGVGKIVSKK